MNLTVDYPGVMRVIKLLHTDQGDLEVPEITQLPHYFHGVQGEFIDWSKVERVFAALNEDGLCNFAIGDEDNQNLLKDSLKDGEYATHAIDTLYQEYIVGYGDGEPPSQRYVVEMELDGATTHSDYRTMYDAEKAMGVLLERYPTASISIIDKEPEGTPDV